MYTVSSMSRTTQIPVTVLCGFLGSGKTTLLRRWRNDEALRGAALIVHDLSDFGLDAELLSDHDVALEPGKTVLHMEFTPRGEAIWISARDDNRVVVYDTTSFAQRTVLPATAPSGIFFTSRAARTGF